MSNDKVYGMLFSKVYPLLVSKAVKKAAPPARWTR